MLRIALVTYGSRGDTQPLLALALALQTAGHEAFLAAPPENAAWAARYGCDFQPLGVNLAESLARFPDAHTLKAVPAMGQFLREQLRVQFEELPAILKGVNLVLIASLAFSAPSVAQALNVPYHYVLFCPQIIPSRRHPSPLIRNQNLPAWLNRASWWLTVNFDPLGFMKIINNGRRRLGLSPVKTIASFLLHRPVLVASDPDLALVPDDIQGDYIQTGYWHLTQTGELSPALMDFIAAGPPPVYIGFGSMPSQSPGKLSKLLLEAIRAAGQRAILAQGWAHLGGGLSGPDVFVADELPHEKLFPLVSAVVHHGGSGTTATAARAGAVQIIVPQVLDQYYWANRVFSLGLGPRPIYFSRLRETRLAAAIHQAVTDREMRLRAESLARILKARDGLKLAVGALETLGRS
ncbi:MAG: glycosyltransferase [Thermodesulfobacteriota bacterium]